MANTEPSTHYGTPTTVTVIQADAASGNLPHAVKEMYSSEERLAWDRYAAAALGALIEIPGSEIWRALQASKHADNTLEERRKRFGGT